MEQSFFNIIADKLIRMKSILDKSNRLGKGGLIRMSARKILLLKIAVGICMVIVAALLVVNFREICKCYTLNTKINEIDARRKPLWEDGKERKLSFLQNQKELKEIVDKLIHTYKEQSMFIEYLGNGKILCNRKTAENEPVFVELYHFLSQKKMIKPGAELTIIYEYYKPMPIETKDYRMDERSGVPALFKTNEGRYRIDFYLIESDYVRMGLKYISIDDVDVSERNENTEKIFGERIAPGWFYYISPSE